MEKRNKPLMILDAHHHLWHFNASRHEWMTPGLMDKLRQDYLPNDLQSILEKFSVQGTVVVQVDQNSAENEFLIQKSREHPWIKGIVGWVDLKDPNLEKTLQGYRTENKIAGFRHILQSEPKGFMLDPNFIWGLELLSQYDFSYDLLIYWHQMEEAIAMIEQLPNLRIVLDHLGKPDIRDGRILKWERNIRKLASFANVYCKISGVVTEAHWKYWQPEDLYPYMDAAVSAFGKHRIIFGSDWPVCLLASSYQRWIEVVNEYTSSWQEEDQRAFYAKNCIEFYRLKI